MKPILIDDLIKDDNILSMTTTETHVTVDGVEYTGWQIAKPMNYDPKYFSMKDRKEMADAILEGKGVAFRFFEDLTEEEQIERVEKMIIKQRELARQKESHMPERKLTGDSNNHGISIK